MIRFKLHLLCEIRSIAELCHSIAKIVVPEIRFVSCKFSGLGCLAYNFSVICPKHETGQDDDRSPKYDRAILAEETPPRGDFVSPGGWLLRALKKRVH